MGWPVLKARTSSAKREAAKREGIKTEIKEIKKEKEAMKAQLEKEVEIRAKVNELLNATNPAIQLFKVHSYLTYCITLMYCITSKIRPRSSRNCTHMYDTYNPQIYFLIPNIRPRLGTRSLARKNLFHDGYRINRQGR